MKQKHGNLVIIPAHNEEKSLPWVIRAVANFSPESDILVVNDCSLDATSQVAKSLKKYADVTVLDLPYNLGIGGAMQAGFLYARDNGYDVAIQIDGDGQHSPKFIKDLKDGIIKDSSDLVVGSRFIGKKGFKGLFLRRIGIRYFSKLIEAFTGMRILDATSGFRAFSKRAIAIFAEYYPHDYPEVESFVVLKKVGFKIIEIPVVMKRRKHGVSTINWIDGIYYMVRVSLGILISSLRDYSKLKGEKNV